MSARSLLSVLLFFFSLSCATPVPFERGHQEVRASDDEACARDQCLDFYCDEEGCAAWSVSCDELEATANLELVKGGVIAPPAGPSPRRWWGRRTPPSNRDPVFIIPWNNHHLREQRVLPAPKSPHKMVKHHVFPQADDLARWFKLKGIDIHQYTLLIPENIHVEIHRGARGGRWNSAWRDYRNLKPDAPRKEIFLHAGELIFRFELLGRVVPYYGGRAL